MGGGGPTQEAGAQDNLLELNPNDPAFKDIVGDWQDGQEYVFKELRVVQVSPGKYTPLSAESAEVATEDEDEMPMADEMGAMGKAKDKYPNPAVAGLVAGEKV
jgi:hypothetical protein